MAHSGTDLTRNPVSGEVFVNVRYYYPGTDWHILRGSINQIVYKSARLSRRERAPHNPHTTCGGTFKVCASLCQGKILLPLEHVTGDQGSVPGLCHRFLAESVNEALLFSLLGISGRVNHDLIKIGRASCRERV